MSKDIKKALEHCVEWKCDNCPNRDELGSGEIVCRGRLLPEVLEYVADLEAKLAESEKKAYSRGHSQRDIANEIKLNALREDVANKEKRIVKLKQQLEKSEKSKESYRLQNEHHHLQLLQFYSRLGVEAFGADIHEKALETLMIMKEQLAEKDAELEKWSTQYAKAYVDKQNALIAEKVELQHQLAEKDEEIESLKHFKVTIGTMETNQVDISSTTYIDQDKISFALEQLEQIRKEFEIKFKGCKWGDKMLVGKFCNITNEIIDNTINELKKVK